MQISWLSVLKNAPALKKAIDSVIAPGASQSDTVWFNLIKATLGMLGAVGVYFVLTDQEMKDLSAIIPSVITGIGFLVDALISIRLRIRTKGSLQDKVKE